MSEVVYIGEFDYKYQNKELSKIFLVSKLQLFRSFIYDKDTVEIFAGSKLFLYKNKALNFAETLNNNIYHIHYVEQSYPIIKQ